MRAPTAVKALSSGKKGLNGDSSPNLCDASAVLYQLSYQANWELVVTWVDKPVDNGYRSVQIFNPRNSCIYTAH